MEWKIPNEKLSVLMKLKFDKLDLATIILALLFTIINQFKMDLESVSVKLLITVVIIILITIIILVPKIHN